MVGILHLLSLVLGAFAFALMPPAIVAVLVGEGEAAYEFLLIAGLTGFVAGGLFFAFQGQRARLSRRDSYILALGAWVVPSILAAVPFASLAGLDAGSALLEAVSGYTTTGATTIVALDAAPRSIIFWRAELQWLGGLMTLILAVLILAPSGLAGLPTRHIALVDGSSEGGTWRLLGMARGIFNAYGTVTLALIILLLMTGLPSFDAICLAFATVSTGGFMPRGGTIADYGNAAAEFIIMVFMLIGATSILWQRMVLSGRWQLLAEHREDYWVIGIALSLGICFAISMAGSPDLGVLDTLREGLFTGVSVVTTTGFEGPATGISSLPIMLVVTLAVVGGSSFSTAGGLKYFRVGAMFAQAGREFSRLIHPHGVRPTRFGSETYDTPMMKAIWSHFILCVVTIALASVVVALNHVDYEGALLAAVSAFSNVGGVYEAAWPEAVDWPSYADMHVGAKLMLCLTMIAGRLEVVALLGALSVAFWRT